MPYTPHRTCQIATLGDLLEDAFGFRSEGEFVEVGAFDGQTYSNTSFLADLGWRGIYVEPVPHFAAICAARHAANPKIAVVQCAVGAADTAIELRLGGAFTTADLAMAEAYTRIGWTQGMLGGDTVRVRQRRVEDILAENSVAPGFDLLVVDVEGSEEDVFSSFNLGAWRPKMLIVELEDGHPSLQDFPAIVARAAALRQHIAARGYRTAYRDDINTVFVRASDSQV